MNSTQSLLSVSTTISVVSFFICWQKNWDMLKLITFHIKINHISQSYSIFLERCLRRLYGSRKVPENTRAGNTPLQLLVMYARGNLQRCSSCMSKAIWFWKRIGTYIMIFFKISCFIRKLNTYERFYALFEHIYMQTSYFSYSFLNFE